MSGCQLVPGGLIGKDHNVDGRYVYTNKIVYKYTSSPVPLSCARTSNDRPFPHHSSHAAESRPNPACTQSLFERLFTATPIAANLLLLLLLLGRQGRLLLLSATPARCRPGRLRGLPRQEGQGERATDEMASSAASESCPTSLAYLSPGP